MKSRLTNFRILLPTAVTFAALWAVDPVSAQSPPPPPPPRDREQQAVPIPETSELLQLRQQYTLKAAASAKTLSEQFAKALLALEKEAAEGGDYDEALAAQRRRMELMDLYNRSLNDPSLSQAILLKPSEARLTGSVTYDRNENALVNWKAVGNTAVWDIIKLTPGNYDVSITYGVAGLGEMPSRLNLSTVASEISTGGEIEFYEDTNLLAASSNRRTLQVTSTGSWTELQTQSLPPVQLSRTTARFGLRVTRVRGGGGVMHLKEIRLTPARSPLMVPQGSGTGAPAPSQATPGDAIATAREAHLSHLTTVLQPVVSPYLTQLKTLLDQATSSRETEVAEELQGEINRINRMLDNPGSAGTGRNALVRKGLRGDGAEEWTNVHYAARESNLGDRFLIDHDGEFVAVRLIGVSCPPSSEHEVADLKQAARYFGISSDDALSIGKQAAGFTAAFLSNKPLRLITRGLKDKDGQLYVSLFLDNVGDFAGVLVDNGLATITEPTSKTKSGRRGEDALMNALKEREELVKSRPLPPGAWALKSDEPETPRVPVPAS